MSNPTKNIRKKENEEKENQGSGLVYPLDLIGHVGKAIKFDIYEYSKPSSIDLEEKTPKGSISLPIPPELSQGDSLEYSDFEGTFTQRSVDSSKGAWNELSSFMKGGSLNWGKIGDSALSQAKNVAATAASNLFSDEFNILESYSGRVLNPKAASVFENVGFRSYSFNFSMIAENQEESDAIRSIVRKFRRASHPGDGQVFYTHPYLFHFSFLPKKIDDYLFRPNICALTGMNVAYNGTATPTFFEHTGAPVEVEMSLEFKEMTLDTRESLDEKYPNG